jgi:hypothetical protein
LVIFELFAIKTREMRKLANKNAVSRGGDRY